jgi:hypothetical protein
LVILKVVPPDGVPALAIGVDEGSDWITQRGMVDSARDIIRGAGMDDDDE